jgi:hypothetical protein
MPFFILTCWLFAAYYFPKPVLSFSAVFVGLILCAGYLQHFQP